MADRLQFWMPWKERNTMSERVSLINDYLSGDFGVSELSVEYEVSRKTIYKWLGEWVLGHADQLREHLPRDARQRIEEAPDDDARRRAMVEAWHSGNGADS